MTDYKTWKTGVSHNKFSAEIFDLYKSSNIDYMEMSPSRDHIDEVDFDAVKKESDRTGVKLWSLHLPFSRDKFNISHLDKEVREFTLKTNKELIKKAADIGIKTVVIHPSSEPIEESQRPEYMQRCICSLKELADFAEPLGVVIAVEDLPRTCLGRDTEDMLRILESDDRLRVCFDVNHLLRDSHEKFITALANKIVTLHISDYDFIDEVHALPGDGLIDWAKLVTLLEKADYNGPFMYEISHSPVDRRDIKTPAPDIAKVRENHLNIKSFTGQGRKL